MKKMKLMTLSILCALCASAVQTIAQTPSINDVRVTWNVPCQYSTNQWTALVWQYKQATNAIPLTTNVVGGVTNVVPATTPPTLAEWHVDLVRRMAAGAANSYVEQRKAAETVTTDWASLRDAWADLTPAQRQAVLTAAGIK